MAKSNLNLDYLYGEWVNCYLKSKGIEKFKLYEVDGQPCMEMSGHTEGFIPGSWNSIELSPYAYQPESEKADGFSGFFELEDFKGQFILYDNKGLIIVAAVIEFKNDSSKNNWLVREFFFRISNGT